MKLKTEYKIREALCDLAKSILENRDNTKVEPIWPPRYGQIPADLQCKDEATALWIKSKEDMTHYRHCLALLRYEDSLDYIGVSGLDNELWHYYCEIYCDPVRFAVDPEIRLAINALLLRLEKPLIDYEVLISLEKHLELNGQVINLAGVRFFQMSGEDMLSWGIDQTASSLHKQFHDMIAGKSAALISEKCHGFDMALVGAREKLSTALNALRVALLIDHDPRIVDWRIRDEQLLFHSDIESAVREKNNPSSARLGFDNNFRSWQFKVDETYEKQIIESKRILDCLFLSTNAQCKLYRRFVRAVDWIGDSATREHLDDKIVDICTAFETLLAPESEGRKGEAIALRMMLLYAHLQISSFDAIKLFKIYRKRSSIVHGSDRDICTDYDYRLAQWMATDVLAKAIGYVQSHNITQHSAFIDALESDRELMERLVEFWKDTPYYKDIFKFAAGEIAKRFSSNGSASVTFPRI